MECLVCLEEVAAISPIWICRKQCYSEFHLGCIQQFASSTIRPANKLLSSILNLPNFWYCPHCRAQYGEDEYPREYRCFCGQTKNPDNDAYLEPHSCGRTCGRARAACPHSCVQQCHAGPCAKCVAVLHVPCFCGKEVPAKRCGQGPSSCGKKCGKLGLDRLGGAAPPDDADAAAALAACSHPCSATCHDGSCSNCLFPVPAPCRCGGSTKTQPCFKRNWSCGKVCGQALGCGRHSCQLECHSGPCPPCPTATGTRSCPCGKSVFRDLPCDQVVSKCGDTCGKPMSCGVAGHTCHRQCHDGECGPCSVIIEGPCRCGRARKRGLCSDGGHLCDRKCIVERSCGRHQCRRRCCPGNGCEPASGAIAGKDYCPPCREICGRKLSCGNHTCQAFCHAGDCLKCPLTVTVQCACGTSRLTVPCGYEKRVEPPPCTMRCRAVTTCHHKMRQPHACHFGACPPCSQVCGRLYNRCLHKCDLPCHSQAAEAPSNSSKSSGVPTPLGQPAVSSSSLASALGPLPCPPCQVPVQRTCVGGHEQRTLPCSAPALFKCDAVCGRQLPCGKHVCSKQCHALGLPSATSATSASPSTSAAACGACASKCLEPRPDGCSHPCAVDSCHPGSCPPCTVKSTKKCHCGKASITKSCADITNAIAEAGTLEAASVKLYSCSNPCPRSQLCGHACPSACHPGACAEVAPCSRTLTVRCKCGAIKQQWPCADVIKRRSELGISPLDTVRALQLLPCDYTSASSSCKPAAAAVSLSAPNPLSVASVTLSQSAANDDRSDQLASATAQASNPGVRDPAAAELKRRKKADAQNRKVAGAEAVAAQQRDAQLKAAQQQKLVNLAMAVVIGVPLLVLLVLLIQKAFLR